MVIAVSVGIYDLYVSWSFCFCSRGPTVKATGILRGSKGQMYKNAVGKTPKKVMCEKIKRFPETFSSLFLLVFIQPSSNSLQTCTSTYAFASHWK